MGGFSSNNRHIFKQISDDIKEMYQLGCFIQFILINQILRTNATMHYECIADIENN